MFDSLLVEGDTRCFVLVCKSPMVTGASVDSVRSMFLQFASSFPVRSLHVLMPLSLSKFGISLFVRPVCRCNVGVILLDVVLGPVVRPVLVPFLRFSGPVVCSGHSVLPQRNKSVVPIVLQSRYTIVTFLAIKRSIRGYMQ